MHNKVIQEANQYIENNLDKVNPEYRNAYHLMGPIGWINDPNGFVYYQGEYHLFYQFYPYDSVWGPMHWGHAKSKDLVHWEQLPVALAPSEDYDKNGCFSGSAIVKDDKLYLMYTGHVEEEDFRREVQCIAVSEDGIHFNKHHKNPVISEKEIRGIAPIEEFRDPKVFKREADYYSVVASQTEDKRGQILLFKSHDMLNWTFNSVLLKGKAEQGIMWECPDFFHLDGKDVLILSPIEMNPQGYSYQNTSSTIAFIGEMNWKTGKLNVEQEHEIDGGVDFYAPQTCLGPDGERIMVAWMQMWHRNMPTNDLNHNWAGSMTLPRQLNVVDNYLVQKPPREMYSKISNNMRWERFSLETPFILKDSILPQQYLEVVLDTKETKKFSIEYAKSQDEQLLIQYCKKDDTLKFSRRGFGKKIVGIEIPVLDERTIFCESKDELRIEMFRDTSSIELFVNKKKTMTATFFEEDRGSDLMISTTGKTIIKQIELGSIL